MKLSIVAAVFCAFSVFACADVGDEDEVDQTEEQGETESNLIGNSVNRNKGNVGNKAGNRPNQKAPSSPKKQSGPNTKKQGR